MQLRSRCMLTSINLRIARDRGRSAIRRARRAAARARAHCWAASQAPVPPSAVAAAGLTAHVPCPRCASRPAPGGHCVKSRRSRAISNERAAPRARPKAPLICFGCAKLCGAYFLSRLDGGRDVGRAGRADLRVPRGGHSPGADMKPYVELSAHQTLCISLVIRSTVQYIQRYPGRA